MIITNLLCRHKHMHVQITQLNYLMAIKKERRNLLFDKQTIKKKKTLSNFSKNGPLFTYLLQHNLTDDTAAPIFNKRPSQSSQFYRLTFIYLYICFTVSLNCF